MSAEAEIIAILNHAVNNASSLTNSAQELVGNAVAVIGNTVNIPQIPVIIQSKKITNFNELKFALPVDNGGKPGLPLFPTITIPPLPALKQVTLIDADFDATLEALRFPSFKYASLGNAPTFLEADPFIDSTFTLAIPPDTSLPPSPDLKSLNPLPDVNLSVPETKFADIDVDIDFEKDFFTQQLALFSNSIFGGNNGIRGLEELLQELAAMSNQAFGPLFTDFINLIGQQLTSRYQSGLAAVVESSIQQGLDTAVNEEADRVRAAFLDRSGWDLPVLVRNALTATMEQSIAAWGAQSQSQQETDQWEHAQEVFELSATLYEKLRRAIQELKTRELVMVIEAHQQAIQYAKQVTDALLTAFNVENYQKYDLDFKKAESQIKLFEEQLKVQLIEYELVFAQLDTEKSLQEQDTLKIQQYQTELQRMESENRLLATQVSTARTELELQALPVEIFESQIRAFAARVNAYEAQVSALVAEIGGNTARIEAEISKIKGFEAESDAFIANVNASRSIIQAQKQRNDSVLEELQAKVKAALAPVEVSTSQSKYKLAIYEATAKNYLTDAKLALEKAKLDDQWRQEEQKGLFSAYQMTREQAISIANKNLQILKAIAEVNGQGAQVMAQMAGGAMSAANGIANVIFSEG